MGNIRGICPLSNPSKIPYLESLSIENNSIIIALTESHLDESITTRESEITNFQQHRSDRLGRKGGGTVIYVRNDLAVNSEFTISNGYCEATCLVVPKISLAVINIYRPPYCPTDKVNDIIDNISNWIDNLEKDGHPLPSILFTGDLNLGFMETWDLNNTAKLKLWISSCSNEEQSIAQDKLQAAMFLELFESSMMTQFITEGTRNDRILDVILSNNEDLITKISMIENIVHSDHKTIVIDLNLVLSDPEIKSKVNFASSSIPEYDLVSVTDHEWSKISLALANTDWSDFGFSVDENIVETNKSADELIEVIVKNLEVAVASVVQKHGTRNLNSVGNLFRSKNKIPRQFRLLMRKKRIASNKLKEVKTVTKCIALRHILRKAEDDLKTLTKKEKNYKEHKALDQMITDPKAFYRYVNKLKKTTSIIGPFTDEKGNELNEPACETLRKQYESVWTEPLESAKVPNVRDFFEEKKDIDEGDDHDKSGDSSTPSLNDVALTMNDVQEAIKELPSSAAPGPDGVPAILIKKCAEPLLVPLFKLFKYSLNTGDIPKSFLTAWVKPQKKPNSNKSSPSSFRPIALTSNLCKTMERCIRKYIQSHLEIEQSSLQQPTWLPHLLIMSLSTP